MDLTPEAEKGKAGIAVFMYNGKDGNHDDMIRMKYNQLCVFQTPK